MSDAYRAKHHYQDQDVARSYDRERFSSLHGRLAHHTESRALAFAVERYFESSGTVLDLPCGTGRLLPVLLDAGMRVTGADISNEMIEEARKRFARCPVSFHLANAEALPFPDREFDYLTSYRLMTHLPADVRQRVLNEMLRVTKKILVVNYHFDVFSPLYLFNRLFRPVNCSPYPLREADLRRELEGRRDVRLLEIRPLGWYEKSSCLVVLQKV